MSRGICLLACWAVAAGIGLIAAWLTGYVVGLGFFVAAVIALMVGLGMAWALPAIICPSSRAEREALSSGAAFASSGAASGASTGAASGASSAPAAMATAGAATAGAATAGAATAAAAAAPGASTTPASPGPASSGGGHWSSAVAADSGKASDARGQSSLKPAVAPSEEATLRDGVGAWRYEGDKPAAAPASAAKGEDYDGDGVVEGANEGVRPAALSGPRDGGPDDLKRIKGVGPKLEGLLHSLGFYHFDQVASWTADEVAWVDANLEGFKGRVSRDEWVPQAKLLAEGGETAFSKKVDKGDVY